MIPPTLFLIFQIVLAILVLLLPFHVNFRFSLSVTTKKKNPTVILYWNCIKSIDQFQEELYLYFFTIVSFNS